MEDSDEDQDNFEVHLKFRKKALERELELGDNIKQEVVKAKTKGGEICEEEKLFRDLFASQNMRENKKKGIESLKGRNESGKENAKGKRGI